MKVNNNQSPKHLGSRTERSGQIRKRSKIFMTPKFLVQHSGAGHHYSGLGRVLAGLQLQRLVDVDRGERAAAAGSITYDEVLLITHQDVATERKIVVEVL